MAPYSPAPVDSFYSALDSRPGKSAVPIAWGFVLLPLAGIGCLRRRLHRNLLALLLAVAGMASMVSLSGCGAFTNGFLAQSPQTYTLTVTVTGGGIQHSFNCNLEVQ